MARPSSVQAQSRNLSLTEELEKLEQSITLTLQEIDHNFSKAHRIVTTNILPIVEDYAKHSEAVWEGSKFWKQFFEASANVSLSGYEETPESDYTGLDETFNTNSDESQYGNAAGQKQTPKRQQGAEDSISTADDRPIARYEDSVHDGSSTVDSSTATLRDQQTPRGPQTIENVDESMEETSFANYPSPYEALKREFDSAQQGEAEQTRSQRPTTPGRSRNADMTLGVRPSPFMSTAKRYVTRTDGHADTAAKPDPLLHRVLDKTYRIGATPHTTRKRAAAASERTTAHPARNKQSATRGAVHPALLAESSPFSPDAPAPQLRSDIFGSPVRRGAAGEPRTPGISVQGRRTPGRGAALNREDDEGDDYSSARKALFADETRRMGHEDIVTWDSDEEEIGFDNFGISPPKTMQFHIPQSRLLQTPAKEASKRIVEDLLLTAGAASVTSTLESMDLGARAASGLGSKGASGDFLDEEWEIQDDDSPSVVRVSRHDGDDITF